MDLGALIFSLGMLVSLLPSVHVASLVQFVYYLVVPGYTLLRLFEHPTGLVDRIALVLIISLGLLVGFVGLFQTFYPEGKANQSLVIPLIATAASALSLRSSLARRVGIP